MPRPRFRVLPGFSATYACAAAGDDGEARNGSIDDRWWSLRSRQHLIEEVPPGAILDLDDPDIGIETQLAAEALLDLYLRGRLSRQAAREQPIGRPRITVKESRTNASRSKPSGIWYGWSVSVTAFMRSTANMRGSFRQWQ